jgi:hypothetical protein
MPGKAIDRCKSANRRRRQSLTARGLASKGPFAIRCDSNSGAASITASSLTEV